MNTQGPQESRSMIMSNQVWKCVAASLQGSSHKKTAKPCQDFSCIRRPSDGVVVIAVADGAGSAAFAEDGAAVAARTAARTLCSLLKESGFANEAAPAALRAAVKAARRSVETEASSRKIKSRDLASTLLLILASPKFVALAQIGDGAVVLRDRTGRLICLTEAEPSEYINETSFLVSPDALNQMQVSLWSGEVAQVAVLSDGLQLLCLKMPERTPHERFFTPVFDFAEHMDDEKRDRNELINFLNSGRVKEHTDDDITLVLAAFNENRRCKSDLDQPDRA